jgi:hypothetical protein
LGIAGSLLAIRDKVERCEALQDDIEWSETTPECPKDASSYLLIYLR